MAGTQRGVINGGIKCAEMSIFRNVFPEEGGLGVEVNAGVHSIIRVTKRLP